MSDSIAPESRIFRIGRECYIVYLGRERDDIRPFLRIGNTREIPVEVHKVVETTVVTDDHVGNPLLEILNASKYHGRYLGDTTVVATIRRFFKSFDLPTDDVNDYRKVKDGERRDMVWFYSSGNIHLRYDDQVIFDLDKKEKEDRHFVRLYEEAKGEFLRNPLRYIRQDFNGPGIILAEGNVFWYETGDLLSFTAHPGFVAKLMYQGTDPDFISASAYDLKPDDMDSHDAAVYIGFVKRMRQRRKQLRVITTIPELQRKLKLLFPARGESPATLEVADVSGKKKATFRDSIISNRDGAWHVHRAGLPEISIAGTVPQGVSVDPEAGRITVSSGDSSVVFTPPPGFPIDLIGHDVPDNQAMDKYIGYVLNHIKDLLSQNEQKAALSIEKYLRMLRDDMTAGKAAVSPLLKQNLGSAKDALKSLMPDKTGISWFFFANAYSVLNVIGGRLESDHPLAKSAAQVAGVLKQLLGRMENPDPILPFWGDLYVGEESCLLWHATKRGFVPADLATTRDVNGRINTITSLDESPWHDDLERLLELIRSLGQGGEGPLSDEQMALLAPVEEHKKAERKTERRTEEPVSGAGTGSGSDRQTRVSVTPTSTAAEVKPGKAGRERRRWPWLILILLLLLGAGVIWDFSGTAPWGRVLPGRRTDTSADLARDTDGAAEEENNGTAQIAQGTTNDKAPEAATPEAATPGRVDKGGSEGMESSESTEASGGVADKPEVVDSNLAPRTLKEVEAYLDVDGRVAISEADIHLAANEIAVINGYKDLDYRVFTGNDPDWIYPGASLSLPDGSDYLIRRGDTIWFLAAREVRTAVERDLADYDSASAVLANQESSVADVGKAEKTLRRIASESRAKAMRSMASSVLNLSR